jgi:predicted anti-sigma-YlaC factor YlaD
MKDAAPGSFAPTNGTAYYMILGAVQAQRGLVHGRLHDKGEHCAIGSYFAVNTRASLDYDIIDEVAAVNDSVPHLSTTQRKRHVLRWLKWKLTLLGMSGYRTRTPTKKTP